MATRYFCMIQLLICATALLHLHPNNFAAGVKLTSRQRGAASPRSRSLLFVRDLAGERESNDVDTFSSSSDFQHRSGYSHGMPHRKLHSLVAQKPHRERKRYKSLLFGKNREISRLHRGCFTREILDARKRLCLCKLVTDELVQSAPMSPALRRRILMHRGLMVKEHRIVSKLLMRLRSRLQAVLPSMAWILTNCWQLNPRVDHDSNVRDFDDKSDSKAHNDIINIRLQGKNDVIADPDKSDVRIFVESDVSVSDDRSEVRVDLDAKGSGARESFLSRLTHTPRTRLVSRLKLEPPAQETSFHSRSERVGTKKSGFKAGVKDVDNFQVSYDLNGTTYNVKVGKYTWLNSAPTYVIINGSRYSTADGTLTYIQQDSDTGGDVIGDWLSTSWWYNAGNLTQLVISIRQYTLLPLALFSQYFVNDTVSLKLTADDVVSGFPAFYAREVKGQKLGFLSYGGSIMGTDGLHVGNWTASQVNITSGRGSGPLVLFNNGSDAIVVAPFNNFMTSSVWLDTTNSSLHWGPMGSVTSQPGERESSFILYYGNMGISRTVQDWGELMQMFYHKDKAMADSDNSIHYLGYSTGHGAYFYNHTLGGKTMEQQLEDVRKSARILHIPYRHLQLGPWWYPRDQKGGTVAWVPSSQVFPFGLQDLYDHLGWTMPAENGAWSSNTSYAKQNGGQYDFALDPPLALPLAQDFWDDLFQSSREWGLSVYQQDALDVQFSQINASTSDVYTARDWLQDMGEAARQNQVFLQYGDTLPRHALASLEIAPVTRAQVSADFQPDVLQWGSSYGSLLAWALGLAPVFNTFWTNASQPLNPFGKNDSYPQLRALMATLSTGPVSPGDDIGTTDMGLLMRCCNQDGLILKPSTPLIMLDEAVQQMAFQIVGGLRGQLWQATSNVSGYNFGVVMAADMDAAYILRAAMTVVGKSDGVVMTSDLTGKVKLQMFDGSHALTIPTSCSSSLPCLYYLAPIMGVVENFVVIYGELGKWVPMSPQRVTFLSREYEDITLDLVGAVNETVTFLFVQNFAYNVTISCNLGPSASARMSYSRRGCVPL